MTQTIAILGDVHGNGRALAAALAQARNGPHDRIVFVGDLLTYGHDVAQVLDLVHEAQERDGAELVVGNHDQMYFDLDRGETAYFDSLPEWLRQSIELTRAHPRAANLENALRWAPEVRLDDRAIVGHANPAGAGDWRYLNAESDHVEAAEVLRQRGLDVGVFGHTHRPKWFSPEGALRVPAFDTPVSKLRGAGPHVVNAGAVGQPRDNTGAAVLLRMMLSEDQIDAVFERVAYDVQGHIAALRSGALPVATVDKLTQFFLRRGG